MSRPFPWKCRTCGEKKVRLSVVPDYSVELDHDGRSYSLSIPNLEVLECEACKTRVLPDNAHSRITLALREKAGLLTPVEIRKQRETLRLTQKQLANCLRVAESTVCRWETDAQIQQRSMDLLLRAFFDLPSLRQYLGMSTKSLDVTNTTPNRRVCLAWPGISVIPSQPRTAASRRGELCTGVVAANMSPASRDDMTVLPIFAQ